MTADEALTKLLSRYIPKHYIPLIKRMEEEPMSIEQIKEFCSYKHRNQAYKVVAQLKAAGVVCIKDWVKATTVPYKVYGLGNKDARFNKYTRNEISARYRERKKTEAVKVWGL